MSPPSPLMFWQRLFQAAACVVLALSTIVPVAPAAAVTIFDHVVHFHQPSFPVEVPNDGRGYIHFTNGAPGAGRRDGGVDSRDQLVPRYSRCSRIDTAPTLP